ncbi:uncharacterized protein [Rutidosis leptorrhynchoides]|uniref:uncharacterized protein n=1 Tax=Rutidosis leptorrhynchoides TaxID=125765 RepID=UPI003A99C208
MLIQTTTPPTMNLNHYQSLLKEVSLVSYYSGKQVLLLFLLTLTMSKVKSCPKEEEKVLVDEIIRLYHDMIFKWNEVRIVLALHQFSRIDLSNRTRPELVSVYNFNHLLEYIPIDIMPSIRDTTADVLVAKYGYLLDRGIKVILEPTRMRVIADVGDIAWYHLKAFIAGDLVVVTGTHIRDHPPFRFKPVPQRMVKIPRFPYLQEEIKAFTPANNQGQLNIVFDRVDESKVDDNIPKIYRPKIYSYDLE